MASSAIGSSSDQPTGIDLDPRSAIPLAIAVALFAITVWFIRSVPRTLSALALASLFALALNPMVEALKHRTGWNRRTAAGVVLVLVAVAASIIGALITVPTINEVRDFNKQIPKTVKDLGTLPIVGPRLREANASENVQKWLNDVPKHLSANSKPIENAAGAVADGLAAALFTILLAITILLDGDLIVGGTRRLVPARRRAEADRMGRLVYEVVGRYIAGTLLVAALAGVVMLTGSLALSVPLAPLIAVWVAITNPIPQIGGFLGGVVFVMLALTQGAVAGVIALAIFLVYQQLENHVLQPLIIGRAVRLSPPATMVAALVGVAAGGLVGGLFAIPLLGATKAIYLSTRSPAKTNVAGTAST
ncbi:MAG TPA: AI-2E family transporter [Acidimicrobiia bacterium]|nr:AI-2E family transporter [Acidimicrobiia bacterium]